MKKDSTRTTGRSYLKRIALAAAAAATIVAGISLPFGEKVSASRPADPIKKMYGRPAPNFDLNESLNAAPLRQATGDQIAALAGLKSAVGSQQMVSRWNDFGGSPDVLYDFASRAYPGTPEEAARAFVSENAALFGVTDANNLRVFSQRSALGGNLIRFQQLFNGIPVQNGGIGIVMNGSNQVVMA